MKHQCSKTNILLCLLGISVFIIVSVQAMAQEGVEYGNEQVQKSFGKAVEAYNKYHDKNSIIYTGRRYTKNYGGIKGHQFFLEDYWELGNVVYDGNAFDSIEFLYDTYNDQLLIENFSLSGLPSPIQLYGPKVQNFALFGYYFIRLSEDSLNNIKEGYYNLMYDGPADVLVKRRKELVKSNDISSISEMFVEKDKYYILKDNTYYQVRKRGSILKVLEDKRKELKSFIRKNGFNFKGNTDEQLAAVVEYYSTLH